MIEKWVSRERERAFIFWNGFDEVNRFKNYVK